MKVKFAPTNLFTQLTVTKVILGIVLFAVWGVFLWRAIIVFAPDSDYVYFNSDGAIPILMAKDQRPITVFDTYYYGSDRWGAWPLLIARLINHQTHYRWSDKSIHAFRVAWLFLGVLVLALLNRGASFQVVLICLATICLHDLIRLRLFDISQVYTWQIPPLLIGWYSLRRFFDPDNDGKGDKSRVKWALLLYFSSLLSIWRSVASGPFLCFLAGLEAVRAHLKTAKEPRARHLTVRRYVLGFILVIASVFSELLLRWNYHRHGLKHFGNDFKTLVAFDLGYLTTNLEIQLRSYSFFTWWPWTLLPLLAVIALVGSYLYYSLKGRREVLQRIRDAWISDDAIMVIGLWGVAVINFVLIVLVNHVRLNLYDNRFATLTFLFGSISGLLTLFILLKFITERTGIRSYSVTLLTIAGFLY
ncbi:MAG: hypothetical protein ACRD6N_12075, partial [Pyrinomonadaceae bacterium]